MEKTTVDDGDGNQTEVAKSCVDALQETKRRFDVDTLCRACRHDWGASRGVRKLSTEAENGNMSAGAKHIGGVGQVIVDTDIPSNGVCRSCQQPVIWVTMLPSKKPTPINPSLEHGGNVEIRPNKSGKLYGKVTGPDVEERKRVSHFATCPQAGAWRQR